MPYFLWQGKGDGLEQRRTGVDSAQAPAKEPVSVVGLVKQAVQVTGWVQDEKSKVLSNDRDTKRRQIGSLKTLHETTQAPEPIIQLF